MDSDHSDVQEIDNLVTSCTNIKKEISKVIIGQNTIIEKLLITIFSGGHAVLIGVPGLAKTLLINTIAKTIGFFHYDYKKPYSFFTKKTSKTYWVLFKEPTRKIKISFK